MKNASNPQRFGGELSAASAITKTQNLAQRLRESVFNDWPKIQPFINRGKFTVQKSIPQA